MAQMKEQIKTPEKELRDEEIDKLSDAEFKTLVTRMLTEMVEFGRRMKEGMKAIRSEIKENCFPGKVRLKEFIITKLLFDEMLKGLI